MSATTQRRPLAGTRVLVAGAGLAGLAAADRLQAAGADVTIVEARERVGGRVWTIRDGFADAQHAEAGADLIEGEQTHVRDLARRLGLEIARILPGGFGYYGPAPSGARRLQSSRRAFAVLGDALEPLIRDYLLAERRWDSAISRRLAAESVALWLERARLPRSVRARAEALRGLFLADVTDLSLLALVDFMADVPSAGPRQGLGRIAGGNDQLATGLAAGLRKPVEFQAILRRVRRSRRGVAATIEAGGRRATWTGDYLVSALPASTLREVTFEPALPEEQATAVEELRYGAASRLLLQCDRRFWRRPRRPLAFATAVSYGALWDGNQEQRGRAGILSFLAGGRAARELASLVLNDGTSAVLQQVRWLGAPSRVLHARLVRWDLEQWSRGGYAYVDPAFDPRWRDLLARPAGRVVFAGEHTSIRWQGYMNGAVESGLRAAAEIEAMHAPDR